MNSIRASLLLASTFCLYAPVSQAENSRMMRGTGLTESTPEEEAALHRRQVKAVHPNLLGLERKNKELRERGKTELDLEDAAQPWEEIEIIGEASETNQPSQQTVVSTLPLAVDNSSLDAFPPVGDQGVLSSSASWASTYYQLSHETCRALNCRNKDLSSPQIFSPKWTYNLVNGGVDHGQSFYAVYNLITKNGAASFLNFPAQTNEPSPLSYLAWDLKPDDWKAATSYRAQNVYSVQNLSGAGASKAKQILANGHLLVVGTDVHSWVYGKVAKSPIDQILSPHEGEMIATSVDYNGSSGHAITIVGYDEHVFVDFNSNGVIDPGEIGAFKVVNSWGSSWGQEGDRGFMWVAYDALFPLPTVENVTSTPNRRPIFWEEKAIGLDVTKYTPTLFAAVKINTAARGSIKINLGSSSTDVEKPVKLINTGALNYSGGPFAFDGGKSPIDGTFYFDLTDVIDQNMRHQIQKYYIVFDDLLSDSPVVLKEIKLIDNRCGGSSTYSGSLPMVIVPHVKTAFSLTFKLQEPGSEGCNPR